MEEKSNEFCLHPLADVQTQNIGAGSRIWQFVVILPGAKIGKGVNICSHCFIENQVEIGDGATIKSGVQIWDGVTIEAGVFIGPNVSFTNDKHPISGNAAGFGLLQTRVCKNAAIGAGAVILPGVTIGEGALVGAGAVVTRDVPARALVVGNPAKIVEKRDGGIPLQDH